MPEFAKELARKNLEQVAIRDDEKALDWNAVSYTHLTLPTILRV